MRKVTRKVVAGPVVIGGASPISIQSMITCDPRDREACAREILRLCDLGCDVVRFTLPDLESAENIPYYKKAVGNRQCALVADIHFDYRIALRAAELGIDKIRINPGNIGDKERVRAVAEACHERNIPIRIGVNSGSLEKRLLEKYSSPTSDALVESALNEISALEEFGFSNIVLSVKSSDVVTMIDAYRKLSSLTDYPLHLGVTEAGTLKKSLIKSSVGIGTLLSEGIGDTIRVSITDDVKEEVIAGREILSSLGLYTKGSFDLTSCPTCGRTKIDLVSIAKRVENALETIPPIENRKVRVAVMGCVVNGPGEAREADIGIAGGQGEALLFKKGEIIAKVEEEKIVDVLIEEIEKMRN
ncbi:MAG: flavodoxin-dependent (E)-4-hydroxy-3-methylbut-2-enyl-diphosphate synthase [Ruminococcaceae bacterium]|nr:flavodoxin-dependent (E)-4-hydroxy-3-methylbut-2-enyl-diphosphate synthase [Oscillospiraceae bacterium]